MFKTGDMVQHVATQNVYLVGDDALTVVSVDPTFLTSIQRVDALFGVEVTQESDLVGKDYAFDTFINPNDYPNDYVKV